MVGWLPLLLIGIVWYITTDVFQWLDPFLFPGPTAVLSIIGEDYPFLFTSLLSSLTLLFVSFGCAIVTAIPLGLLVGQSKRIERLIHPFTNLASPIPPIVYIPYAVALLPTFWLASSFILYIGAFWPVFLNTVNGVKQIDHRLLDSAHTLGISRKDWYAKILLPGAMPSIFSGMTIGLVLSFILLTAAEIVGGSSGLGWYVKNYSDFGDYPRVVSGILFIGLVVAGLTQIMRRTERYVLRWRER
ncbi:ABC transporter permease [Aneurinibacillus danicus]|uniref:ABC transporter permease n=1 Tax=Aneurinibacillus danicus TaxID=267746 RepID=A0A511V6I1_9BACL|nr:ABC transporter permease [Aneurinibacillus danicus]GEN33518.1 ABC transporter permease [Aneurinibacillus danicus]